MAMMLFFMLMSPPMLIAVGVDSLKKQQAKRFSSCAQDAANQVDKLPGP
jgi:hypothetical protein